MAADVLLLWLACGACLGKWLISLMGWTRFVDFHPVRSFVQHKEKLQASLDAWLESVVAERVIIKVGVWGTGAVHVGRFVSLLFQKMVVLALSDALDAFVLWVVFVGLSLRWIYIFFAEGLE